MHPGNCDRRAAYLEAASQLLVDDLAEMVGNWTPGGKAKVEVQANPQAGLAIVLTGMGLLSYGELVGGRMKLGLLLHDQEEEHDCFSDNTHNSHLYSVVGIRNVYLGSYKRLVGSVISSTSLADLVASKNNKRLDVEMKNTLNQTIG